MIDLTDILINNSLIFIGRIDRKYILVKSKYSTHMTTSYNLKKGYLPTIKSALDKNEYFVNKAKEIHNDKYDYSNINYITSEDKIIIKCNTCNNIFEQVPYHHLAGHGCKKCANNKLKKEIIKNVKESPQSRFLRLANIRHNNFYDYTDTIYNTQKDIIEITCPIHGKFLQRAKNHLRKSGCQECAKDKISKARSEYTTGWNLNDWINASKKSKYFDSYKMYIIEVYNNNERFIKIGRTYNTVRHRFRNKKLLPYNYKILLEIVNTPEIIFKFENQLKKELKEYKYKPLLKFSGMKECFKLDIISKLTKEENKNIIVSVK